jgi:hypothetical protein
VVWSIALALGGFLFSGVFLMRYQPLTMNGGGATFVDPRFADRVGDFTPPDGEPFSAYVVHYEDGLTMRYGMTLYNRGPLPVTITEVGTSECDGCTFPLVFERSLLAASTGRYVFDHRHARPFEPFVLEPGVFRYVILEDRFDHCESYEHPGDGVTSLSIPVRYRTWFVQHEVQLPMPYSLEVRMQDGCPEGMGTAN